MHDNAPPADTLSFLGVAIWQGNVDDLVEPPPRSRDAGSDAESPEAPEAPEAPDALDAPEAPDGSEASEVEARGGRPKTVRLTERGKQHLTRALDWLEAHTLVGQEWPAADAHTDDVKRFCDYFRIAALLMEGYNDVPGLRPRPGRSRAVPADAAKSTLPERLRDTLLGRHAPEVIGGMISTFTEQLTAEPCPVERDLDERLHAAKQLVAFQVMLVMHEYRIMATAVDTLKLIDETLEALARTVARIAKAAAGRAKVGALTSPHRMHAIFGLVSFHRARVLRARGGVHLAKAMQCLADSLQCYEDRSNLIRPGERPDDGRRNADYYHASLVVLQEAYYFLLQGMLSKAASTLRSGRLLSRAVRNTVLDSEFELIALSIERSRLRHRHPVSPPGPGVTHAETQAPVAPPIAERDVTDAGDEAREQELDDLAERLEKNVGVHRYYRRATYARMNRYQAALLHDFRGDTRRAKETAERILRGLNPSDATHDYWIASSHLLLQSLASARARHRQSGHGHREVQAGDDVSTPHVDPLAEARREGAEALEVIKERADFEHLRADCNSRLAEVAVLQGRFRDAETYLRVAVPTSTAGYTTNANVSAALVLIRAEMELRQGNLRHAVALLERFRDTVRPHLETGRLLDYHDMLERQVGEQNPLTAFVVTDQTVMELADTDDAYAELKRRLQRFLIASGRRLFGNDASDRQLATMLGVDAKTIRSFKKVAGDQDAERARGEDEAR